MTNEIIEIDCSPDQADPEETNRVWDALPEITHESYRNFHGYGDRTVPTEPLGIRLAEVRDRLSRYLDCEHCSKLRTAKHACWGTRAESMDAARFEDMAYGRDE